MGNRYARSRRRSGLVASVVTAAMTLAFAAPASANEGVPEEEVADAAFFVNGDGVILVTGPPFEEGCFGEGFPQETYLERRTPSGVRNSNVTVEETDAFLVQGDDFFTLLDEVCPALAAGEPSPAVILATGTGSARAARHENRDGSALERANLRATLETPDGAVLDVRAHTTIAIRADGSLDVRNAFVRVR